jgi:hypothetical protein
MAGQKIGQCNFKAPAPLLEQLKLLAVREGTTITDLIIRGIHQVLGVREGSFRRTGAIIDSDIYIKVGELEERISSYEVTRAEGEAAVDRRLLRLEHSVRGLLSRAPRLNQPSAEEAIAAEREMRRVTTQALLSELRAASEGENWSKDKLRSLRMSPQKQAQWHRVGDRLFKYADASGEGSSVQHFWWLSPEVFGGRTSRE